MFKIINLSLGYIKVNESQTVYFPYENIKEITKLTSPCDCSDLKNDKEHSRVSVVYKPKKLPEHLKEEGKNLQQIQKLITVFYKTEAEPYIEQTIVLSFNAIVKHPRR